MGQAPSYQNSLRDFGFGDVDFEKGGSDALVCWGEPAKIADHVRAHLEAGANHVAIQAHPTDGSFGTDEALLERLAELLL